MPPSLVLTHPFECIGSSFYCNWHLKKKHERLNQNHLKFSVSLEDLCNLYRYSQYLGHSGHQRQENCYILA